MTTTASSRPAVIRAPGVIDRNRSLICARAWFRKSIRGPQSGGQGARSKRQKETVLFPVLHSLLRAPCSLLDSYVAHFLVNFHEFVSHLHRETEGQVGLLD